MHVHGWIDSPVSYVVCPGDWIITGSDGLYVAMRPDIFDSMYKKSEPESETIEYRSILD
jgi:hypothetical protein